MPRGFVNMDGSDDAGYRYKMPAVIVKVEGKSKMIKTVIENLPAVCHNIGRPTEHLLTFLGQRLSVATKMEKDGRCYVTGVHDQGKVQKHILDFISETVACSRCGNMETTCHVEGKKKSKAVFLICKASSCRTDLDATDRFVKYIMQHPPEAATYGQAAPETVGVAAVMARATAMAEATSNKPKTREVKASKQVCRACGHRTSKATCKKCGLELDHETSEPSASDGGNGKVAQLASPRDLDPLKETVQEKLCAAACDVQVKECAPAALALNLSAVEGPRPVVDDAYDNDELSRPAGKT